MIRGVHHTAISTPDLDRALRFYRDVLGFEECLRLGWEAGDALVDSIVGLEGSAARNVFLRAGNAYLELFHFTSPAPARGDPDRPVCDHGITHVCLDVVDLPGEYERLLAAGMRFHCPPVEVQGVRTTYGRDPDGNVVELQEVLDIPEIAPLPPNAKGSSEMPNEVAR